MALAFGLLAVAPARADNRHRVVLLEPAYPDRTLEIHARLRGELEAAGFEVVVSRVPAHENAQEVGQALARELLPLAVLYVLERPQGSAPDPASGPAPQAHDGEIWISDRLLRRSYILKFDVAAGEPAADYSRVAVEAVEVLKARLAELSVTREERREDPKAPEPEPPVVEPASETPPSHVSGAFHAGAGVLQGFDGIGPVWTPLVRTGISLPPGLMRGAPFSIDVLGVAAFYGAQARVQSGLGSAGIRQSLVGLEVWGRFAPDSVVQPVLALSGGAYRTEVEGSAADPELENSGETWSVFTGIGTGVWAQPSRGFAVVTKAEFLVAWARTVVEVANEEVATAGSPMLFVSLSAVGMF
jgi:hypothetical protein